MGQEAHRQFQALLQHVDAGCVSDHPSHILYRQCGTHGPSGLPLYRGVRGTGDVEGAIHTPVAKILKTANAGPTYSDHVLREFRYRYNVRQFAEVTDGMRELGHPDVYLHERSLFLQKQIYGSRRSDLDFQCAGDYDLPVFRYGLRSLGLTISFDENLQTLVKAEGAALAAVSRTCTASQLYMMQAMDLSYPVQSVLTLREKALFVKTVNGLFSTNAFQGRTALNAADFTEITKAFNGEVTRVWVREGKALLSSDLAAAMDSSSATKARGSVSSFPKSSSRKSVKGKSPEVLFKLVDHMKRHFKGPYSRSTNVERSLRPALPEVKQMKEIMMSRVAMPDGMSLTGEAAMALATPFPDSLRKRPPAALEVQTQASLAQSRRLVPAPDAVLPSSNSLAPSFGSPFVPNSAPRLATNESSPMHLAATHSVMAQARIGAVPPLRPLKRARKARSCGKCNSTACPARFSNARAPCSGPNPPPAV